MKKKLSIILLLTMLLTMCLPYMAFAYNDGGLINTNQMEVVSNADKLGAPLSSTGLATDNDVATYETINNKSIRYVFSTAIDINAYRLLADVTAGGYTVIRFYNSAGTLISSISDSSAVRDGTSTSIPTKTGVKTVLIENSQTANSLIKEFNVYGPTPPPDTFPPSNVTSLSSTFTDTTASLTWVNPVDADFNGVKVYQGTTYIETLPKTSTTYNISGLTPSTAYTYKLTTLDTSANESTGNTTSFTTSNAPDLTPTAVPTGLTATPGDGKANLSWTANVESDIKQYNIYKDGVYLNSVQHPSVAFEVSGLTNGTSYSFQLSSKDLSGNESLKSSSVSVTPVEPPPAPPAPTGLQTSISSEKVVLSWNAVPTATKYFIYRDSVKIQETTSPTYTDTGLTNGTQYNYQVSAVNENGESLKSVTIFSKPSEITDLSGVVLPFSVKDMIGTAINFLAIFPDWILLTLGIIFVPALIFVVLWLVNRSKEKENEKLSGLTEREKRSVEKGSRYAGMTKEQWDKFKVEEIRKTDEYYEKTGRVYEKRSDKPKPLRVVNEVRGRRKDGTLNARERKRIEERSQKHILKMRKEGR